jgi:Tol biopolymer transport system component
MRGWKLSKRSTQSTLVVLILFASARAFAACDCPSYELGQYEPAYGPDGMLAVVNRSAYPPYYELCTSIFAAPDFVWGCCCYAGNPTWAPDGNHIAFDSGGIYIMTRGQPDAMRVPGTDVRDSDPAWSPAGGTIAFVREGEVWSMSEDGGSLRQVTSMGSCSGPAISPDGGYVAFASGGSLWVQGLNPGSTPRRLTNGGHPAWSPNGRWIAFESDRAGNLDVWVIAVSGGTAVRVTSGVDSEGDPSWSSDGTNIAYTTSIPECGCVNTVSTLPDYTVGVQLCTWAQVKVMYR